MDKRRICCRRGWGEKNVERGGLGKEDRNTTYFNKITFCRKHSNVITLSMVWLSDDSLILDLKVVVSDVFKSCFAMRNHLSSTGIDEC